MKTKNYCIKDGYHHRTEYAYFDDTNFKDLWQREVYEKAEEIFLENKFENVVDVGCGSGYKLLKHFQSYNTIGIDVEPTVSKLKKEHPQYKWLNTEAIDYAEIKADLVICSDVIEHVEDPVQLLYDIGSIKNVKKIILSTPERLLVYNREHDGPPANPTHIREWNFSEFANFIGKHFKILDHYISNKEQATQVIICSPLISNSN